MEWVETTGRTVEEALEAALDELGVDEADADYEVLEEPKVGLFGRLRTEARVRARVRPSTPRPKDERRPRPKRAPRPPAEQAQTVPASGEPAVPAGDDRPQAPAQEPEPSQENRGPTVTTIDQDVPISEQAEAAAEFLRGVLERFGSQGEVVVHELDEDTVELRIDGEDLGRLIGPKGSALQSLQELTRTVVQRKTGARSGRILVDVSGYRQRRREALARFAAKVAEEVRASGVRVVLEPMIPADRKVIHDTINEIEGVATTSEGEEPQRRVVVSPATP
ncbi:MAG: Jag N-terminal domain-containing protein [Actinobacteria bacterium]|nr:Jag N-terminal domain-containing protein [Actinomycetota bacterium]MBW3649910.1 Jag N-terminal domain-containing protein [Actinomycetota bacterium]